MFSRRYWKRCLGASRHRLSLHLTFGVTSSTSSSSQHKPPTTNGKITINEMASNAQCLDALPAEIIKKIASFCPATSVLALLRVSRHLRSACNDPVVFRSIIAHRNHFTDQEPWDMSMLPVMSTDFARFALADLKARERHSSLHASDNGDYAIKKARYDYRRKDTLTWELILAIHHHPFIADVSPRSIIQRSSSVVSDHPAASKYGLDFVLVCALLQQYTEPKERGLAASDERFPGLHPIWKDMRRTRREGEGPPQIHLAIFAASLLMFKEKIEATGWIPLPSPLKLPFPALMADLPPPFSDTGAWATALEFSHLKVMTSKAFLEAGEWVGYYSYQSTNRYHVVFDPPMRGIRFTVSDKFGDGSLMTVGSTGFDSVGKFVLSGEVTAKGEILIQKLYESDFGWTWRAKMTPFGIVGSWGRDAEGRRHVGDFWLWKREWVN